MAKTIKEYGTAISSLKKQIEDKIKAEEISLAELSDLSKDLSKNYQNIRDSFYEDSSFNDEKIKNETNKEYVDHREKNITNLIESIERDERTAVSFYNDYYDSTVTNILDKNISKVDFDTIDSELKSNDALLKNSKPVIKELSKLGKSIFEIARKDLCYRIVKEVNDLKTNDLKTDDSKADELLKKLDALDKCKTIGAVIRGLDKIELEAKEQGINIEEKLDAKKIAAKNTYKTSINRDLKEIEHQNSSGKEDIDKMLRKLRGIERNINKNKGENNKWLDNSQSLLEEIGELRSKLEGKKQSLSLKVNEPTLVASTPITDVKNDQSVTEKSNENAVNEKTNPHVTLKLKNELNVEAKKTQLELKTGLSSWISKALSWLYKQTIGRFKKKEVVEVNQEENNTKKTKGL